MVFYFERFHQLAQVGLKLVILLLQNIIILEVCPYIEFPLWLGGLQKSCSVTRVSPGQWQS